LEHLSVYLSIFDSTCEMIGVQFCAPGYLSFILPDPLSAPPLQMRLRDEGLQTLSRHQLCQLRNFHWMVLAEAFNKKKSVLPKEGASSSIGNGRESELDHSDGLPWFVVVPVRGLEAGGGIDWDVVIQAWGGFQVS
jgi:hypothetical protein